MTLRTSRAGSPLVSSSHRLQSLHRCRDRATYSSRRITSNLPFTNSMEPKR